MYFVIGFSIDSSSGINGFGDLTENHDDWTATLGDICGGITMKVLFTSNGSGNVSKSKDGINGEKIN